MCDLTHPAILEAYKDVTHHRSIDWLLLGYNNTRDIVSLYATGHGGLGKFRQQLKEEIMFGFIRLENTFVLINWIPRKLSGIRKARALVHSRSIAALLKLHHIRHTATGIESLSDQNIQGLLYPEENSDSKHAYVHSNTSSPLVTRKVTPPVFPVEISESVKDSHNLLKKELEEFMAVKLPVKGMTEKNRWRPEKSTGSPYGSKSISPYMPVLDQSDELMDGSFIESSANEISDASTRVSSVVSSEQGSPHSGLDSVASSIVSSVASSPELSALSSPELAETPLTATLMVPQFELEKEASIELESKASARERTGSVESSIESFIESLTESLSQASLEQLIKPSVERYPKSAESRRSIDARQTKRAQRDTPEVKDKRPSKPNRRSAQQFIKQSVEQTIRQQPMEDIEELCPIDVPCTKPDTPPTQPNESIRSRPSASKSIKSDKRSNQALPKPVIELFSEERVATPLDISLSEPDALSGFVSIQTVGSPFWKRRYFIIQEQKLTFFRDELSRAPLQTIDLSRSRPLDSEQVVPNSFILQTESLGKFHLYADDRKGMNQILDKIEIA